jgi:hypothetical protein
MTDTIDEFILPLVARCRPMRVSVKLRKVKDKYYIDFDGSKTYNAVTDWNVYWASFEYFVKTLLDAVGIKNDKITKKDDVHCTAYVGTLFDFLIKTHE